MTGPISRDIAMPSLRYPVSRDAFSGKLALPQNDVISHFATYRATIA